MAQWCPVPPGGTVAVLAKSAAMERHNDSERAQAGYQNSCRRTQQRVLQQEQQRQEQKAAAGPAAAVGSTVPCVSQRPLVTGALGKGMRARWRR